MKLRFTELTWRRKAMLLAAMAVLAASSVETNAGVNKALIRAVRGKADYSKDNGGTWKPVRVGNAFTPGTIVRTRDKATVDCFLGENGPVVRITSDSELSFEKLDVERGVDPVIHTHLKLLKGRILGNVKKLAPGSVYEIETPVVRCTVRGTEYDIKAIGIVTVVSGMVVVHEKRPNGSEQTHNVHADQTFLPGSTVSPGHVVPTTSVAPMESDALATFSAEVVTPSVGRFTPSPSFRRKSSPARSDPVSDADSARAFSDSDELWVIARPKSKAKPSDDFPRSGAMLAKQKKKDVPLPLKRTDVKASISAYIATVEVQQQFQNPFSSKIEAVYVFPLPENAAVNEFLMTIGDRRIRGIIREREEAEQIYTAAKHQGYTASLLTQERPNVFTQSVANIEPGKQIDVTVKYFHTLAYVDGWYEFVFPMVVGPRFNPPGFTKGIGSVARAKAGRSGQRSEVSYLKPSERSAHDIALSVDVDAGVPIEEFSCPSHRVTTDSPEPEQLRVALAAGDRVPNKDFVLRYRVAGDRMKSSLLTHRDARGGFFSLMLYPPRDMRQLRRHPMEFVFVLDCSGSMSGRPLAQAKAAIERGLHLLQPGDSFQLINFSNDARQLGEGPLEATRENVRMALQHLVSLESEGGTMMITGIKAALDFPHDRERLRFVCFLTDGYIGNEDEILGEVQKRLGNARIFSFGVGTSVNRYLLDSMARVGRGVAAYLGLEEDGAGVMQSFFDRASHPALTDVQIDWGGLHVTDVFPSRVPDLFVGRPVVVTGRFNGESDRAVCVRGRLAGQTIEHEIPVNQLNAATQHNGLPLVWARSKITELATRSLRGGDDEFVPKIRKVALDYQLMSAYTAFVAVDSSRRTAGEDGTTVPVAVPVPEGVKYDTTVQEK